ncbi:MAG: type II toxin-antitoxin system prevent-host-death family antitoxin [Deltaproteobacteria bacterium]|nr:type II toxin-antitoxin system prevent-host-death family antitoxin [Deltaproteobacteria bacterium]
MQNVTFSELRNNAKKYFDAVESGETLEVYRNGKPIAMISPAREHSLSRWRSARPLKIAGISLSRLIMQEREE